MTGGFLIYRGSPFLPLRLPTTPLQLGGSFISCFLALKLVIQLPKAALVKPYTVVPQDRFCLRSCRVSGL